MTAATAGTAAIVSRATAVSGDGARRPTDCEH